MIQGISHIGHAVNNMQQALKQYKQLFDLEPAFIVNMKAAGNNGALLPMADNLFEVLEPTRTDGFVGKFLQSKGEGLYYVALLSDNINEEIRSLREKGKELIEFEPTPELPFKTAWIHPRSMRGNLIELISTEMYEWLWKRADKGRGRARISHVGHVVKNLDEALQTYIQILGHRSSFKVDLSAEGIVNTMIPLGRNFIELLWPVDPQGFVGKFLKNKGEGLYHISLAVKNVEEEVRILKSRGAKVMEFEPTSDMPYKTAWVHPASTVGILIEIIPEELLAYLSKKGKK